jgi:trans-2-enoyl-CoA reductase
LPQLLPTQHYACSRSLCTAYRLLEDYGNLRPGDTIIQNCSDLPTGQAIIQLVSAADGHGWLAQRH